MEQGFCIREGGVVCDSPFLNLGKCKFYRKEGEEMVEFDQFKAKLTAYKIPLSEVRDSL